jgi:hypothetical protein
MPSADEQQRPTRLGNLLRPCAGQTGERKSSDHEQHCEWFEA